MQLVGVQYFEPYDAFKILNPHDEFNILNPYDAGLRPVRACGFSVFGDGRAEIVLHGIGFARNIKLRIEVPGYHATVVVPDARNMKVSDGSAFVCVDPAPSYSAQFLPF